MLEILGLLQAKAQAQHSPDPKAKAGRNGSGSENAIRGCSTQRAREPAALFPAVLNKPPTHKPFSRARKVNPGRAYRHA